MFNLAERKLPKVDEIVVCKITRVLDYGVFVDLLEYSNAKGFIHISQVASRWIKNIRNFVKEGQMRAAAVLSINMEKNQIDLSLTKVPESVEVEKLEEYRQLKRATKMIEMIAQQNKEKFDVVWEKTAAPLIAQHGSLYEAFQQIAANGEKAASGVDKKFLKPLVEFVQKSISIPLKTIKGEISLNILTPDGVELIKDALKKGLSATKDAETEIYYSGSGKYVIRVTSTDYKVAERVLKLVSGNITGAISSAGGIADFKRID